jgi:hypothetical protein
MATAQVVRPPAPKWKVLAKVLPLLLALVAVAGFLWKGVAWVQALNTVVVEHPAMKSDLIEVRTKADIMLRVLDVMRAAQPQPQAQTTQAKPARVVQAEDLAGTWRVAFGKGTVGTLSITSLGENRVGISGDEVREGQHIFVEGTGTVQGKVALLHYTAKIGTTSWQGDAEFRVQSSNLLNGFVKNQKMEYDTLDLERIH